jgi:hypothetical protein
MAAHAKFQSRFPTAPFLLGLFTFTSTIGPTQTLDYTFGHVKEYSFVPVCTTVQNIQHNSQESYHRFSCTAKAPTKRKLVPTIPGATVCEDGSEEGGKAVHTLDHISLGTSTAKCIEEYYTNTLDDMQATLRQLLVLEKEAAALRSAASSQN